MGKLISTTDKNVMITGAVKEVLDRYDVDDLLRTIPYDYKIDPNVLSSYSRRCRPTNNCMITISKQHLQYLEALSGNSQAPISLVFNFLIECVADCGKIHTKNIKHALDCYYYALNNDKELFSQILEEYSNSPFYHDEIGLSEEGVAYFLTISRERSRPH